jgi:alanyl-tRNA synthetase
LANTLKCAPDQLLDRTAQSQQRIRELEKSLEQVNSKLASAAGSDLAANAQLINGVSVLSAELEGADAKTLRSTMDQLKNKLGTAVIVLAVKDGAKVQIAAGVTKDSVSKVKAGDLVNFVAGQVGGKGGGKPDMAMAGGSQPDNLAAALASVEPWVTERLV